MQIARKKHKSLTVNVERGNREPTERDFDFGFLQELQNAANLESGEERAEIDRGRSGSLSLSLSIALGHSFFNRCEWHETNGRITMEMKYIYVMEKERGNDVVE